MTTDLDTIILSNITAQLDEVARSLAGVPGRAPQDRAIAYALLELIQSQLSDAPGRMAVNILAHAGANDAAEIAAIASALEALALRLGAWLGRER